MKLAFVFFNFYYSNIDEIIPWKYNSLPFIKRKLQRVRFFFLMFTVYKVKFSCWGRGSSSLTEGQVTMYFKEMILIFSIKS